MLPKGRTERYREGRSGLSLTVKVLCFESFPPPLPLPPPLSLPPLPPPSLPLLPSFFSVHPSLPPLATAHCPAALGFWFRSASLSLGHPGALPHQERSPDLSHSFIHSTVSSSVSARHSLPAIQREIRGVTSLLLETWQFKREMVPQAGSAGTNTNS